ncbi:UDP-glucose:undecaprenyl-phosphate glucose-1-phosphate transferase [Ruminiclostridium hungatei]|uniref:UDP-glucose:undecaprenyl-phosphate glucose-1-phosphate transferase n=1 Tax=Ruminiclostridium hungatei TaxID=48256 RepID=A0A1V4SK76_RUMHU|nr:sugar transferase [Ruminiclostridium hungatei]OPX44183.1 UDP-glucose:undecaprenyl-phosphate glucose-1-phosphate transferase [Ruminiclostridium hungatei]
MDIKLHNDIFVDFVIVLSDILAVIISYALAAMLLFGQTGMFFSLQLPAIYITVTLIMLYTYEFYTTQKRNVQEIILSILAVTLLVNAITIVAGFVLNPLLTLPDKQFFIIMAVSMFVFLCLDKVIVSVFIKYAEGKAELLVIESKAVDNALARKIKYAYVKLHQAWYIQIDVEDKQAVESLLKNEFKQYQSIFICPSIPEDLSKQLISEAFKEKKQIYIIPDFRNTSLMKKEITIFDDTPVLRIKSFELSQYEKIIKRVFDIITASIGIIAGLPLYLLIAFLIKIDSKGPVFYYQERITTDRKAFKMYKFRTMVENAEGSTGPVLASENDKRITRIGKILRTFRLDELPQLFNVLTGAMSIVGPRPERAVFIEQYCGYIENYDKRFVVKAGITGQAQVYGRYMTTPEDKTLYDLLYISNYSFWLDIKIILLTVKAIFDKESAEGVGRAQEFCKRLDSAETEDKVPLEKCV